MSVPPASGASVGHVGSPRSPKGDVGGKVPQRRSRWGRGAVATLVRTTPSGVKHQLDATSPNTRFAREGRRQEPSPFRAAPGPSGSPNAQPQASLGGENHSLASREGRKQGASFARRSGFRVFGRTLVLTPRVVPGRAFTAGCQLRAERACWSPQELEGRRWEEGPAKLTTRGSLAGWSDPESREPLAITGSSSRDHSRFRHRPAR